MRKRVQLDLLYFWGFSALAANFSAFVDMDE